MVQNRFISIRSGIATLFGMALVAAASLVATPAAASPSTVAFPRPSTVRWQT